MTEEEAYEQADTVQKQILAVLFSYGPIFPNRQKLAAAQKISTLFELTPEDEKVPIGMLEDRFA